MKDIICLSPSPCYDKYIYVKKLSVGAESYADKCEKYIGGKGTNVASTLAANGISPKLFLISPEDDLYGKTVMSRGIDVLNINIKTPIRENITFIESDGTETRISENSDISEASAITEYCEYVKDASGIVILSGSVGKSLLTPLILALSKAENAELILDSRSVCEDEISLLKPLLMKPNEDEAQKLTGIAVNGVESAFSAAEKISSIGVRNVIVSLGKNGAVMLTENGEKYYAPCIKVDVNSTVGAGDAMIAGFAAAYSNGKSMKECFENGVVYSAAACTKSGTEIPTKNDVERIADKVVCNRV